MALQCYVFFFLRKHDHSVGEVGLDIYEAYLLHGLGLRTLQGVQLLHKKTGPSVLICFLKMYGGSSN